MNISEKVYERFTIKINKNAQTDNVQCDRARFAEIFNENKDKWLEWTLEKRNEDDIRYAQVLLVNKKILPSYNNKKYQEFPLPDNYFDLVRIHAIASTECCSQQKIELFEEKAENTDIKLQDEDNKPSFDFRESIYNIASNKVIVYIDDFTIDNINLYYYRYPIEIQLKTPEDPESGFKEDVDLLLDNKALNRIVSMCASDFALNNDNQKYQAENQRVVQKF